MGGYSGPLTRCCCCCAMAPSPHCRHLCLLHSLLPAASQASRKPCPPATWKSCALQQSPAPTVRVAACMAHAWHGPVCMPPSHAISCHDAALLLLVIQTITTVCTACSAPAGGFGFFHCYELVAKTDNLDFVVHCGGGLRCLHSFSLVRLVRSVLSRQFDEYSLHTPPLQPSLPLLALLPFYQTTSTSMRR